MNYTYDKEKDLCEDFLNSLPDEWTAYPETGGFDIVLLHDKSKIQVGIEAKLVLNPKVLSQILPSRRSEQAGPDFRAILVPSNKRNTAVEDICEFLGITILRINKRQRHSQILIDAELAPEKWDIDFYPSLPNPIDAEEANYRTWFLYDDWFDCAPIERIELPITVPRVSAGVPSPKMLTPWKIKAMQLLILLEKYGYVTRTDFKELKLNQSLWSQSRWLSQGGARGQWVENEFTPNFKAEYPENYREIEEKLAEWLPPNRSVMEQQRALL
ncbi:hypothetical protein [Curvivirga aplysinae]|uniref:hypothetical protein n=1 Tax=Curvivirga aplysinae TaxID=2529852 RepID=UPI0012BB84D0|nr:hypothetical protein [Curvivirga aplysinae]MTI10205.1 hypothetical protein [Curvivirga aplysinae]